MVNCSWWILESRCSEIRGLKKARSFSFRIVVKPFISFTLCSALALPREQRLHFRDTSWRAKSSYFSHASSYRENVASARRVLFHKQGFAFSLVLKVRVLTTRKWPIVKGCKFRKRKSFVFNSGTILNVKLGKQKMYKNA